MQFGSPTDLTGRQVNEQQDQMSDAPTTPPARQILDLLKQGKKGKAYEAARAALTANPVDQDVMALLASLCVQKGELPQAEALLRRSLGIDPTTPTPWLNLGRLLQQLNRWGEALKLYEDAARVFSQNETIRSTLGQLYQRAGRFAEAAEAFGAATALAPEKAASWMALGVVELRLENLDQSIEALGKAIALNPDSAAAYGNLGNALQKKGDMKGAEAAYKKALALDPKNGMVHVSLGMTKLRLDDPGEAARIFERTLAAFGPERRAAAWLPFARAQDLGEMPMGTRAEIGKMVKRVSLETPEGFASLADFNAALAEALIADETQVWEPAGKATRGGGQTGLLLDNPREPFITFEKILRRAIDSHFDTLTVERGHAFLGQIPRDYRIDLWGTLLAEQGHQHSHIHVGGWMSGVYYVALPSTLGDGETSQDGWIEFGRPPPDFKPRFEPVTISYEPREGDAFFFPSYLFHRTLPFTGQTKRISLAFDIRPISWR